ncbi:MAG: FHA domain-containing protein [Planctomycetales bacterium]|nr:FHA domain-containing protein [Planctomycetales bacterium]NIM10023.1 FHA domain-containing protein [Planctomycetales bacterium]NIN09464.1 FHA domain-containing protein [Planctomycetales bacterium]NIN78572.1 FHA domain-containing protein [Planctomycetales bacterium]NIO35764.1 FHA domain-containing protein [Planctomycetales bacterium]
MTVGSQPGSVFPLNADCENRIGRGLECSVILTDPLCSRVHAILSRDDDLWTLRDAGSRNGSYVNEQKVDEATLSDRCRIRVGSTEFAFSMSDQPPGLTDERQQKLTQTIVKDHLVNPDSDGMLAVQALRDLQQAKELLVLYQLSIKLMGLTDPESVIRVSLELASEQVGASVIGFLWVNDAGQLVPKLVIPQQATEHVRLSQQLTKVVCQEGHAVWIANQREATSSDSLQHYADAICVPLLQGGVLRGAVHVYRDQGHFQQNEFDFVVSVANIMSVALVRARRQTSLETDLQQLAAKSPGYDEMVGACPAMQQLKSKIQRLARATGCVLIRGESGTGKELVARAIQRASPRAEQPLLSVNCAAIPRELIESQLFGHQAGAFTGADRDHVGYFQQADLGTLLLDEVGELPLEGQAKLLRILEGHPFLPVGSSSEVTVDVRVIAATNQDLEQAVREKKFREDLYYRLSVFELTLPPLRQRGDDILLLIDSFLDHYRRQHGRPGLTLSVAARQSLLDYSWPGNVRQLRNVIDSAVVLAEGEEIQPHELGLRDAIGDQMETLKISDWEKRLIAEAVRRAGGNMVEAAKMLGIGRATLYRKLDEYQISRDSP